MYPKPYYVNLDKVKAIVLGADPSTKGNVQFRYVFGINQSSGTLIFKYISDNENGGEEDLRMAPVGLVSLE